jgi:hypothetical protein
VTPWCFFAQEAVQKGWVSAVLRNSQLWVGLARVGLSALAVCRAMICRVLGASLLSHDDRVPCALMHAGQR